MDPFTGHGGRLEAARRLWPDAPRRWIDLSTGINPLPYPAPRASRVERARLPDPEALAALEAEAAAAFGLDSPARAAATPGAEAALHLLPRLAAAAPVWIAEPTYGGHRAAWVGAGSRVVDTEAEATVAVVVNPNNPNGRVMPAGDLLALADRLAARDGWLVVDEAFAEVEDAPSIAAHRHPRIVALRSFGKFYGLAGLRLGFVLGDPAVVRRVRAAMGAWPVSVDAIAAGLKAYPDRGWAERSRVRLRRSAAWLDEKLLLAGFEPLGGTSLFRLVRAPDARRRFEALCAAAILTRPFEHEPSWLRFGLPHPSARARVAAALESL